jgi:hypothetical protein
MDEAKTEFVEKDAGKDADSTAQHSPVPPAAADEQLATTRMPPLTPPPPLAALPPPARSVSQPPPPSPSLPSIGALPPLPRPPSFPPASPALAPAFSAMQQPPAPRTSWWGALVASTVPPPGSAVARAAERDVHKRIGGACAGSGIALVLVGLIVGLHGVPADPTMAPVVMASTLVVRGLLALGVLAFAYGLLRMAERFYVGRRSAESDPAKSSSDEDGSPGLN